MAHSPQSSGWRWVLTKETWYYLIIIGMLIFVRPKIVHRFFDGFVSSWSVNFFGAVFG